MSSLQERSLVAPKAVHELLSQHILADGYPIVFDLERSEGVYLHDSLNDRRLLDFFANFATIPVGYNHPRLLTPEVGARLARVAVNKPANSDLYTTEMAEFVATFARTLPEPMRHHLFFIAGGALAVENAMKAAFDWKVRKNLTAGRGPLGQKILHFRDAFHGRSGYTLSVTNTDPTKTDYFPKFDWPRVRNPKLSFPLTQAVIEAVSEDEGRAVDEIKSAFSRHRHDIAAILIEPIQGEGGDNHFRGEFLRQLRQLADEEDALLIFDEVQTGFGATGRWWCFEHFDVLPDLLAFGKKTQVCGVAGGPRLDEVQSVFHLSSRINSTWGGNLVDMVRSKIHVEVVEEEGLLERARSTGSTLLSGLEALAARHADCLSNVRGRGLFVAFDLPSPEKRSALLDSLRQQGLLALASGKRSIRFRPALVLTEAQAQEGLEKVEAALPAIH